MTRLVVARDESFFATAVRLLQKAVSFRRAAATILGTVTVASVAAVPLKVTVDGIFYLSSAKSLFKADFAKYYVWYREPGYPFFLKMIHYLGNDGMFIVAVQALCLALAAFVALYSVRRVLGYANVTVWQVIVTVLLTLNPMFLIYSGLVLQQALFTLQLALFVLGVVWAMSRYRPKWLPRPVLLMFVALNYLTSIWTSIGWLYLALVPVTLTAVLCYWPRVSGVFRRAVTLPWQVVGGFTAAVATIALCVLVYAGGLQSYKGWEAIKAPYLQSSSVPGAVIAPLSTIPDFPTAGQMTERMLALVHIGVVAPYIQENDLFLRQQMLPNWAYAQWDTAYVAKPFSSYAPGYFSMPNPSELVHNVFARASVISPVVYSTAFVGFALLLILSLIRRKWRLLLVLSIPLAFLAVYAASNSPIDRYGIPSYPWAVASVVVLLYWLRECVLATSWGSKFRDTANRNTRSDMERSAL